jgi:hypothetical protein
MNLQQLIDLYLGRAIRTVSNSDQMGAGAIAVEDAELMGPVLVAKREPAEIAAAAVVSSAEAAVSLGAALGGVVPLPPPVAFFEDPDDPTLFLEAPKGIVYHSQIGIVPRGSDFTWLSTALDVRVQKFVGHQENLKIVRDWTRLSDLKNGIIWDFYIRTNLQIGYRVQFRDSTVTEWSPWHFEAPE